ncbi:MAG: hypothetical protein AAF514_02900, partial [Verrucomicrobiota bacterium]
YDAAEAPMYPPGVQPGSIGVPGPFHPGQPVPNGMQTGHHPWPPNQGIHPPSGTHPPFQS